ncbi:hypothetical protein FJV76_12790 [Mesorhizobium sp. WSM4303]|nr:hypothetical protein FJV77_15060 [Mesorhizobium sp. WSM4306]TRD04518.1 hypothetical protein FJV76_12790 [Mesorhizobium sp. WSM4303]
MAATSPPTAADASGSAKVSSSFSSAGARDGSINPDDVSPLEQFQEKCEAVFRPELRQNKKPEQFAVSVNCSGRAYVAEKHA